MGIAVRPAAAWSSIGRADRPGTYHPPVAAPITDPFRAPPGPYGPGNRGIEYATTPGTSVVAIGSGVVVFAGPVAGQRHVTVRHPDGLRSSYSYLATIAVREGDVVTGRTVVGRTGARLHLGVRRDDVYLDPADLWGRPVGPMRPVLVPLDGGGVGRADRPLRSVRSGRSDAAVARGAASASSEPEPVPAMTAAMLARRSVGVVARVAARLAGW